MAQAKRLSTRQAGNSGYKLIDFARKKKEKINPRLAVSILLSDESKIQQKVDHFVLYAKKGDKISISFLTACADEKLNKSIEGRRFVLKGLSDLADQEIVACVQGLIKGVRDSNDINRGTALRGLYSLSKKGFTSPLPGLLVGVSDTSHSNRFLALCGLKLLAEYGVKETIPGLEKALSDSESKHRLYAVHALAELAKSGESKTLPGLIRGAKDLDSSITKYSIQGIKVLAKKRNSSAIKFLSRYYGEKILDKVGIRKKGN